MKLSSRSLASVVFDISTAEKCFLLMDNALVVRDYTTYFSLFDGTPTSCLLQVRYSLCYLLPLLPLSTVMGTRQSGVVTNGR